MIQKAHEISLEAGSKMATAMKDVIFAAAGLTPFAAESAKDLINYMVRRGQMGSEEAERIIRDIEAAAEKRGIPKAPPKPMVRDEPPAPSFIASSAAPPALAKPKPAARKPAVKKPAAKKTAKKK